MTLTDDDLGTSAFMLPNMAPGETQSRCLTVTYQGSLDANVRLYGSTGGTGLDADLQLTVTRGTAGSPCSSCAGFSADATDYLGLGAGVVYTGSLRDWADNQPTALDDPLAGAREVWTQGESHGYRFAVSLPASASGSAGLTATQVFTWEARDLGDTPAASAWHLWSDVLNHDDSKGALQPNFATVAGLPYVAWSEWTPGGTYQIRAARLNAAGTAWSEVVASPLNYDPARNARQPSVTDFGGVPYVAWSEFNGTDWQLRVAKLNAGGTAWTEVDGRTTGSLAAAGAGGAFSGTVPPRAGGRVCVVALNRNQGDDTVLGCRELAVRVNPFGAVDEVSAGPAGLRVRGWVIDPDSGGPADVRVTVDGVAAPPAVASARRPDVGAAFGDYGPDHGYDLSLPARPGHPRVCVSGLNLGPGSGDSPLGCRIVNPGPPPVAPGQRVMTVATINILGADDTATEHGYGSFAERLDDLATAAAGFDVVGLQEVASADQVRQLAERAGYPYWTLGDWAPDRFPDQAILSSVPLADVHRYEGPKSGCVLGINCGGPVWIVTATAVVRGQPVRIVNTHLSGDYAPQGLDRSAWRAEQAAFIRERLVDPFTGSVVVVGDFNGYDDLVRPKGPLTDAADAAPTRVEVPDWGAHCGDRIDLVLTRAPMAPLAYDGVYGGDYCAPSGVTDHVRVGVVLSLPAPAAPSPQPRPSPEPCRFKPGFPPCSTP